MKILLVDDHTLFRDGLTLILKDVAPEYESISVGNCDEALAQLASTSDIALVLLDLGLPDVSGTGAIEAIRQAHPAIPLVVLSGAEDPEHVQGALRAGAMGFIPKSHSREYLLGALSLILVQKGFYIPKGVVGRGEPPLRGTARYDSRDEARVCTPSDLGLTARQANVLYHVLQGKPNKVIARELAIEDATVRAHVSVVLKALHVTTRAEAIVAANRLGLLFSEAPKPPAHTPAAIRS
jgi:DNA-binding NarL/FixJ family response regulator